jgi:hypothetical protein
MASINFHGKRKDVAQQIDMLKDSPLSRAARAAFDALPAAVAHEGDVSVSVQSDDDSNTSFVNVQSRVQLPPK